MALTEINTKSIKDGEVKAADIADSAISLAKIENGTTSDNGKFLKNNDGAAPSWSAVNTDLVSDTSPQLGGDLDTNDHEILLDDNHAVKFGANTDLIIKSDGDYGLIQAGSGSNDAELKLKKFFYRYDFCFLLLAPGPPNFFGSFLLASPLIKY